MERQKKYFNFLKKWKNNIKDNPLLAIEAGGAIIIGGFLTALLGLTAIGGLISQDYKWLGAFYSGLTLSNLGWYTTIATKTLSGTLYQNKKSTSSPEKS